MADRKSKKDTVVNIDNGPENMEGNIDTQLPSVQEDLMGVCGGIPLTMDPMLGQASPPPPYHEQNDFPSAPIHPMLPSTQGPPSRCSPPHLGGPSSHVPSQLRPGGARSQPGGARPKTNQQQMRKKQMTAGQAGVTNGQRMGYEWLQMVSNGQRILNIRPKEEEEEEEMSGKGKVEVATGIFTIVLFFLYLILPYSPFSPWD